VSTGVERANEVVLGKITSCQGCGARALEPVLDLGHHAPCDSLLTEAMLGEPETHFPLVFCRCSSCGLAQLDYAAPPEVVFFPDYPYRTAMTGLLKEHFHSLTHDVTERLGLGPDDLAIDIGSNDGTLLQGFQAERVRVLGIEPTDIAKIAVENGVPTVQAFFSEDVAEQVRAEHGPVSVVTGTNMFAHVNNLFPELRGVATLIGDEGAFVSESHYLLNLIEELQYDTIYHEHLRFYSLKPMIEIFARAGFSIFDVERVPTHGGSIRVWADRGRLEVSERVGELVQLEEEHGLYDDRAFDRFRQRIVDGKLRLLELLIEARKQGPIIGVGAPGRASTLLAYTGVTPELVDSVVELTGSLKIGKYTPGTHIPIVDERTLYERNPPHALVLSWHIGEAILPKIRERGFEGKFIVPLPEPRIVD
jgi:C-methyltransferase-like protein/putative zinc binding protein/methyltransferase family protein